MAACNRQGGKAARTATQTDQRDIPYWVTECSAVKTGTLQGAGGNLPGLLYPGVWLGIV